MVAFLSAHRVAQIFPARARSTAKVFHGRLSKLHMDSAFGLDSSRSLVFLWLCHPLVVGVD